MTVAVQTIAVIITFRKSNKTHWRVGLALVVRVEKKITPYQHNYYRPAIGKEVLQAILAVKGIYFSVV